MWLEMYVYVLKKVNLCFVTPNYYTCQGFQQFLAGSAESSRCNEGNVFEGFGFDFFSEIYTLWSVFCPKLVCFSLFFQEKLVCFWSVFCIFWSVKKIFNTGNASAPFNIRNPRDPRVADFGILTG